MLSLVSKLMMNDTEAVKLAVLGREEGFRAIFANHASFLLTHALRILKNQQSAEDAVQETFASAFKAIATFKGDSQLRTWLYRILYNNALKIARSANEKVLPAGFDLVLSTASGSENRIDVAAALELLPERDRAVLLMVYWDELPLREVSRILEVSENNAKIVLFRARSRFAQIWNKTQEKEVSYEL